jgi:hypothetical protein
MSFFNCMLWLAGVRRSAEEEDGKCLGDGARRGDG